MHERLQPYAPGLQPYASGLQPQAGEAAALCIQVRWLPNGATIITVLDHHPGCREKMQPYVSRLQP